MDRIKKEDYIPTEDDIVLTKKKTHGVQEIRIIMSDQERIVMVDVGQSYDRMKWGLCFVDMTCILYFVAMNEYENAYLNEEKLYNRMEETIQNFKNVCCLPAFKSIPLILFLNKMDQFKIKMDRKMNITDSFPDYDGECDEEKCFEYISHYFKDISQQMYSDRLIFVHGASATDRNKLIDIWDTIANSIILPAAIDNKLSNGYYI